MKTKTILLTLCLAGLLVGSNCLTDKPENKSFYDQLQNIEFKSFSEKELREQRAKKKEELEKIESQLANYDSIASKIIGIIVSPSKSKDELEKEKKRLKWEISWYFPEYGYSDYLWSGDESLFLRGTLNKWDLSNSEKKRFKEMNSPRVKTRGIDKILTV